MPTASHSIWGPLLGAHASIASCPNAVTLSSSLKM
jgi:hypothetical protein